jgi:hypothetical protein
MSDSRLSNITIIQSPKNLSTYPQFFFIISTIPSKYIFKSVNVLFGEIVSAIDVNPIISKNITFKCFFTDNQSVILSVPFSPIIFKNFSGINLLKTNFKSSKSLAIRFFFI